MFSIRTDSMPVSGSAWVSAPSTPFIAVLRQDFTIQLIQLEVLLLAHAQCLTALRDGLLRQRDLLLVLFHILLVLCHQCGLGGFQLFQLVL